jgi:hypothetical protein
MIDVDFTQVFEKTDDNIDIVKSKSTIMCIYSLVCQIVRSFPDHRRFHLVNA